ncbi:MAG: hypothetical protein U0K31_04185 [Blautia sp.]|nr:hypothetical protein [Blautia sp.]
MSGPKSTRYTLTPEQRRILAEARERERKTRREWDKLQQQKNELAILNDNLESATKSVDMLVERLGSGKKEQMYIRDSLVQIQTVIQEAGVMNLQSGLEKLQSINSKIHTVMQSAKKVKELYEGQSKEIAEKLSTNIEDSISAGMMIRVDEEIAKPLNHIESQRKKIDEVIDSVQMLSISRELQEESIEIRRKAHEITNEGFIDNYYAMTVLPFVKKCKAYDEQLAEYGEEFEELTSKHRYYSEYLELPMVQFVFSMDKLKTLRLEVENLEKQCEQLEEQRHISESLDEVMREIGYHVVGSREVVKKSGRKFRNELYHFSEGAVVNITYAANGQISMELGGVDTCDREPSEAECVALCDEMSEFCGDFQEIEKCLKEKGVVLANRISMLPPVKEYAQIINISDYEMTEEVDAFETVSKRQSENKKQALRKE